MHINNNEIKNKIKATAIISSQEIFYKVFLGLMQYFMVYLEELQEITIALNIIIFQIAHSEINHVTIVINN